MKKYIESSEQGKGEKLDFIKEEIKPDTEIENGKEFNGIKLTDKTFTKAEQTKSLNKVKAKEKSDKIYKRRIHICNHEEGRPCSVEEI